MPVVRATIVATAEKIRAVLAALIVLSLAGCIEDQEKQLGVCKMKAQQMYPNDNLVPSSASRRMGEFVQACMRDEGYLLVPPCYYDRSDISGCYEPRSFVGRWVDRAERWFKGN